MRDVVDPRTEIGEQILHGGDEIAARDLERGAKQRALSERIAIEAVQRVHGEAVRCRALAELRGELRDARGEALPPPERGTR